MKMEPSPRLFSRQCLERLCKIGTSVVIRYSSTCEKTLPNGPAIREIKALLSERFEEGPVDKALDEQE
jgi:hypothetical protein